MDHEETQYSLFKGLKSPYRLDPILKSRGLRLAFWSAIFKIGLLSLFSSVENSPFEDKLNVLITFAQKGLSSSFTEVVDGIPYRFESTSNPSQPNGVYQVKLSPLQDNEAETICQAWRNTKATGISTHTWAGFCNDVCVPNWGLPNSRFNEEKLAHKGAD